MKIVYNTYTKGIWTRAEPDKGLKMRQKAKVMTNLIIEIMAAHYKTSEDEVLKALESGHIKVTYMFMKLANGSVDLYTKERI